MGCKLLNIVISTPHGCTYADLSLRLVQTLDHKYHTSGVHGDICDDDLTCVY